MAWQARMLGESLFDLQPGRVAVLQVLVTQDGLHRLNSAGCRQHLDRQGSSAAVRLSLFDTGPPVEPAYGLLECITGPGKPPAHCLARGG